jgi:hypothetical protein
MDEVVAADLRKWAWNEMDGTKYRHLDADKAYTMASRLEAADRLAAWVMSGKLPERGT